MRKEYVTLIYAIIGVAFGSLDLSNWSHPSCPALIPKVFESSVPSGKLGKPQTITYLKFEKAVDLQSCIEACCLDLTCNDVFAFNRTQFLCFKTMCTDDEKCLPLDQSSNSKYNGTSFVVLVRPSKLSSWKEVVEQSNITIKLPEIKIASTLRPLTPKPRVPSVVLTKKCQKTEDCIQNQECFYLNPKTKVGICKCIDNFDQGLQGTCIEKQKIETTTALVRTPITVQILSKNLTLPEDSTKLTAFAIPEAPLSDPYNYEWKLISNQTSGTVKNSHTQTLLLSELREGTYQFKVKVTGKTVYGEAFGNVTVLPRKRKNKPPKASVFPVFQTITLPKEKAIIDGSSSTDDTTDKLIFKWEVTTAPMGYEPILPPDSSCTLTNLIPGNYTLTMTVTDAEGLSDSTTASLLVLEEKDYPPTANAGEDIIIYLPQNKVVLNGTLSTDDHDIVNWEWTRPPTSETELAADFQRVRTPTPELSNLQKGIYTVTLKVTDAKGQSSEDLVTVYVRDPINLPPKSKAGKNQKISLPKTWIILNGTGSSDDIKILSYLWFQKLGPIPANILSPESAITNVTGLTKGKYVFELTVMDNLQNKDSSSLTVTVSQDTNAAPVADAGPDTTVTLPKSVIVLNGSKSHDDLRIAQWEWTRDPNSLAAGSIVGNSSFQPALLLTNVIPGQYIFNLKVWDDQGKSSTDSVSINVHEDPELKDVVQVVLTEKLSSITENRLQSIIQSLKLLLPMNDRPINIKVLSLFPQVDSQLAILRFMVRTKDKNEKFVAVKGVQVVKALKAKLNGDSDLLSLKVKNLDTLICQNKCSNHGHCDQATRSCVCEPFWIENFVRRKLMDGKSNCEWSIIYVGIFLSVIVSMIFCSLVIITCKKKTTSRLRTASKKRYTKLEQKDLFDLEKKGPYASSLMDSDSDSDEEILVENLIRSGGTATKRINGKIEAKVS